MTIEEARKIAAEIFGQQDKTHSGTCICNTCEDSRAEKALAIYQRGVDETARACAKEADGNGDGTVIAASIREQFPRAFQEHGGEQR